MQENSPGPATPEIATWSRIAGWVGIAAHVIVGAFLTFLSGLVAPTWGMVVIGAVMVVILVLGLMLAGRHRWALLILPGLAILAWVVILTIGENAFGWTG